MSRSRKRDADDEEAVVGKRRRAAAGAPWLDDESGERSLDEEVRLFAAWARLSGDERRARRALERRVGAVARDLWPRSTCETFGSSASGMDWFESDLDLRVAVREPMTYLSPPRACVELLEALHETEWALRVEARPHARVPIVVFHDSRTGVDVDVAFSEGDDDDDDAAAAPLRRFEPRHPADQRDLMLLLKAWLRERDLDKPFTGGLGSFRCGVLLDDFLKRFHGAPDDFPDGKLLGFLDFCATSFNFHRDSIVLRHGGRTAKVAFGGVDVSRLRRACLGALQGPRALAAWLDVPGLEAGRDAKRAKARALCATVLRGAAIPPPASYEPVAPYEPDLFGRD